MPFNNLEVGLYHLVLYDTYLYGKHENKRYDLIGLWYFATKTNGYQGAQLHCLY